MAVCAVCNQPCRGHCSLCGASLCSLHRPKGVQRCAVCPRRRSRQTHRADGELPAILSLDFAQMSEQDTLQLLQTFREWLIEKQERETRYLAKRERRRQHLGGTLHPNNTDEDYTRDRPFEDRLLAFLRYLEQRLSPKSDG